jgi:hypothetical protein
MPTSRTRPSGAVLPSLVAAVAIAAATISAQQSPFNSHDDYTEYQLLEPDTHQFHIVYYLGQRQIGAATVLNQTRSGSEGSDISVSDPRTGTPLKFEYRTGAELAAAGETGRLNAAEHYIRAFLPRPVPENGEGRVRIEKTYRDEKSYYTQGEDIVFARSLGIGRNAIVLPAGFSLVSSNVAAQVMATGAGRVKVAFENVNGYAADVQIRARRTSLAVPAGLPVAERGFDFSKTLYDLGDPDRHQVSVRHQFVATTPGRRVVLPFLARHTMPSPVVTDLDTGAALTISGAGASSAVEPAEPLAAGHSLHLRIAGLVTDQGYRVDGGQLAWERTLHEPRTTILLPAGWDVVAVSTPALVSTTRENRVAIQVYNPRPEPTTIAIRAVRRPAR